MLIMTLYSTFNTTLKVVRSKTFVFVQRLERANFRAAALNESWLFVAGSTNKYYTGRGHEKRIPQIACSTASAINNMRSETFFIFVA